MTLEFQRSALSYLIKNQDSHKILKSLSDDVFELSEHHAIFQLLKEYVTVFKSKPSIINFIEFFDQNSTGISNDGYNIIKKEIELVYGSEYEENFTHKQLTTFIQKAKLKNLLIENSDVNEFSDKDFTNLFSSIKQILQFGDIKEDKFNFLLKDGRIIKKSSSINVIPTYLRGLNELTNKKGFASPELIVIMGGPKAFKTGVMINLAVNFVIAGCKVFYADFENGAENIIIRTQQCIAECTYSELNSGEVDDILTSQMQMMKRFGGELIVKKYEAYFDSLTDVENDLLKLGDTGFKPDIIFYDYLDIAKCVDDSERDGYKKIQKNYHKAISINESFSCFCFTPSHVNREGMKKAKYDMSDFSGDFGKAMNSHAAFSIERTEEEVDAGIGRISVVMQREGKRASSSAMFYVEINEEKMQVKEIDINELNDD